MAFTAQQKHDIVRLLGWPGACLIPGNVNFNSVVDDRLSGLNPIIETQANDLVDRISKIDTQLKEAPLRTISSQVGDIKLNEREIELTRNERRRLIRDLSQLLDIRMLASIGGVNVLV